MSPFAWFTIGAAVTVALAGVIAANFDFSNSRNFEYRHRISVRLFGLNLAWSTYDDYQRAPSGAPIAILKSFWIFTRRRAFGYGVIDDQALRSSLVFRFNGGPPLASEAGVFAIEPNVEIPATPTDAHILIENRSDASAALSLCIEGYLGRTANYTPSTRPRSARLGKYQLYILPHSRARIPIWSAERRQGLFLTGATYETLPAGNRRRGRIFGRPEWLS